MKQALTGLLSGHAEGVARAVISEEERYRTHVVVYLSGAHAYGFPSPDSDLDLKAIHVAPVRSLLGLAAPPASADRMEVIQGVEIDYSSNELGAVLGGILKGNGNYIERVLGKTWLSGSASLESLRPLVERSLSRRVHAHYRGFAYQQYQELAGKPTVKKLLYVLRTALTGIHVLTTRELVTDLAELSERYGLGDAGELIAQKRAGERSPLSVSDYERWRERVEALFVRLDAARDQSPLPGEPPTRDELERWLVELRLAELS